MKEQLILFFKQIILLFKVRSIITLLLSVGLVIGWFKGMIPTEQFLPYVTMVLTFYFAKKDSKEGEE